jgi:hypothetical protein
MIRMALFAVLAIVAATATSSAQTTSPYTGQEQRAIKALSDEEIRDLLEARGMGLAKAAELNSYPGPLHVLRSPTSLDCPTRSARRPIRSMRTCGNGRYPSAARSSKENAPSIAPLPMPQSSRRRFAPKSVQSRPCRVSCGPLTWRPTWLSTRC